MKIAVLGTTGMLGSTVTRFLSGGHNEVWEFSRSGNPIVKGNRGIRLDVTTQNIVHDFLEKKSFDYVINCIGLIKQLIDEKSETHIQLAYQLNSDLPSLLDEYSRQSSTRIIQIGTDCVFSGADGDYDENSTFDSTDVYGLSKVDGERRSKSTMTIRTSIIGRETNTSVSLMNWLISQPPNSKVKGFINHFWNGVTTLDFARIINGVISQDNFRAGTIHLVPKNQVTKYELLKDISNYFNRSDLIIEPFTEKNRINRTLSSIYLDENSALWNNAGYSGPPTISEMVQNYALWSS